MYQASNDFHTAVANGNHQIALLVFRDAFFSNEDIDVDKGIEFNDYFNMEEDLAIGQALSNEITFNLFNDRRLLNDYEFGEFQATIGVQTESVSSTFSGNCMAKDFLNNTYIGASSSPYLRKNGSAMANQPTWAVKSLLVINDKLYCFGDNGNTKVFNTSTGAVVSETVNAFLKDKMVRRHTGQGFSYSKSLNKLLIWKDGQQLTYEFVPLGVFIADRPNAPDNIEIDFHCNDLMMKFKDDMPSDAELSISYPITFKALLQALCTKAVVPYGAGDFINSDAELTKRPDEFDNCTMRDVVGWIAEAAGSNARMSRDGLLIMDWLKPTNQSLNESNYMDFQPYWYETQTVDKLYNRTTQNDTETTVGSGGVGYLIQDNPLLKGVS